MAINYLKEEDYIPPADAFMVYKQLVDYHLYFLKQQSKCEFFYWKSLGIFFLLAIGFFFLQGKGVVLSPWIGIVLTGVGTLLMLLQNIRMDFEYGIKAKACVEKGLCIEKKYDYPAKLFSIFEDNKLIAYRGNLLSRFFPMGLISLATGVAGILLAIKDGIWLGIAVAIFLVVILYVATKSYVKTARKILLND